MADQAQYPMQMDAVVSNQPITPNESSGEPQIPPAPQAPTAMVVDPPMPEATPLPPYIPAQIQQQQQQAPPPPSIQAPRTATPNRAVNGTTETSATMPAKAAAHGAPARRYLNEKVTGALLEEPPLTFEFTRPEKPLQVLGEFLLQKSAEQENKPNT
ncbi:uncharacterized protein KY384_008473 [Bacidia gigantensis]|uniref:uncharacterized protein n=1 Tax=Bacidia gigantensis TaxID=2732470 RepID=UPI001D042CA6|nr:uncharacterized protein KY384_008473 [Bacidia gigantensis]KAG8527044.1 hypothetical protein KY384_008473 [Bacidia gigantensis]